MNHRPNYPSDLSDEEWQIIEPLVPPVECGGRPADHLRREIVKAIFYVLRTGCQWHFLPHDLPPWKTVYTYFRNWRLDGTRATCSRPVAPKGAPGCWPSSSTKRGYPG
jgi:transposase